MRRYSEQQIHRTLLKYDTQDTSVLLDGGMALSILEIADPYGLLDRLLERQESMLYRAVRFPYWAEIWPASVALSSWMISKQIEPTQGAVKELGCGLGVVGVALACQGLEVEATDFVEDALMFASHNAGRNGVSPFHRVSYLDWSHPVGSMSDCLIGSDVTYEKQSHQYLYRVVRKLLAPGGRLYLSDPQRPVARPFFVSLEKAGFEHSFETRSVQWGSMKHDVDIHVFVKP